MSASELQFGIFGTFDVANYGDLLFPLVAEAELSQRLGPMTLRRFSYHEKSPPSWPYAVSSVTRLPGEVHGLDGVIIGGGHVIRFDKAVAPGYHPSAGIHHPTGYWLTPALIAQDAGLPVIWNAPGVHGDIPPWAEPLLRLAINTSAYVSVRDEPSRQALEPFAKDVAIEVVPDTAFGVARLVDLRKPSADFLRVRAELGSSEPYVILQATSALRPFARFVSNNPAFRRHRVLVLPVCPVHGDDDTVFDDDLAGVWRLPSWPHPLLLAELIGHASAVVGHSLHLSITALAFGVPLFRPADSFGGKYALLSAYEGAHRLDARGHVDPSKLLATPRSESPGQTVSRALRRLAVHWDQIAAQLASDGKVDANRRTVNRFWSQLPALLDTGSTRDSLLRTGSALMKEIAARPERLYQAAARKVLLRVPPLQDVADVARSRGNRVIDFERIEHATLATEPYEWAFIDGLFSAERAAELNTSFPRDSFKTVRGRDREKGYAYEASALVHMGADAPAHVAGLSPAWRQIADDLLSPEYRGALGKLLRRDLSSLPMEVNVFRYPPRAWLGPHVDLKDKLITHVFYFNDVWDAGHGGCLNVLRSPDMADSAATIPPLVGHSALLVRSEHSWHAVSPVVDECSRSRLSMTVTFYEPGSVSTLWPPGDQTPLHSLQGAASWGPARRAPRLWASLKRLVHDGN